jgi:tRNA 2-thiouridine synthesizing protein A
VVAVSRYTLDCRRLLCPLPVIRVQDRVASMSPGDIVEALCTDPGVLNDIPAWCRINGHRVLEKQVVDDEYVVVVEVCE